MKELQHMENTEVPMDSTGNMMQALLMLSSSGLACEIARGKAECMAQDLTDGYFGKDREDTPENRAILAIQYREYQIRANILFDYVHEAASQLSTVTWAIQKAIEEARQKKSA